MTDDQAKRIAFRVLFEAAQATLIIVPALLIAVAEHYVAKSGAPEWLTIPCAFGLITWWTWIITRKMAALDLPNPQ